MATTEKTLAGYNAAFKTNYVPLANNLYLTYDNLHAIHKKTFGTIGGKQTEGAIETTFGGGYGASSDGTLPEPDVSEFLQPIYTPKRTYARIKIDNLTIESSKKDEHSFIRSIDHETVAKLRNFNRNHGRILCNDGTGALGNFSGSATGTAASPVVTILTTGNYGRRHACFEKGEYVNVNSLSSVFKISSYNRSNGSLTLSRISGTDDLTGIGAGTHTVYSQNGKDNEPYGYLGVLLNSSHYSVSEEWRYQPNEVSAGGAPLDTEMITELVEKQDEYTDETFTHLVFSNYQYRKYISLLEDQKRFPVPVEYKPAKSKMANPELIARVSFGGIQYVGATGNIVCMKHRFLRDDMIMGINVNKSEIRHVSKPQWANRDGTVLLRMEEKDAYEARYTCYSQNCINPFYVGFITGLATS